MTRPAPHAPQTFAIPYRAPLAWAPLSRFLEAHAVPGLERVTRSAGGVTLRRLVRGTDGPIALTVRLPDADPTAAGADGRLCVEAVGPDAAAVPALVRRWLDLDADPATVDAALGADATLGPLVAARPGLRVPGSVDPAETALFAVLGQQVSLAAARTFQGRLVRLLGQEGPDGLWLAPAPGAVAAADTEPLRAALGITGARVRALQALAGALANGLTLAPDADPAASRAALLGLPGIGPWTADYLALRCLGDRDAFLPGDLVLRRALDEPTAARARARSESWAPWRAYATLHLWTAEVFAEPG